MPSHPPIIRAAVVADAPRIAAMVGRYWQFEGIEGFDAVRAEATLTRLLREPQWGACWLAEVDGVACGYVIAMVMLSIEFGGVMAEIDELWLAPEQRGSGLGRALLQTAEQALTARGCTHATLLLGSDNSAARSFYRRLGYRERTGYEVLGKVLAAQ